MPAVRQAAWQGNVGIPGGIPVYPIGINVKNAPYNAYGDGVHNDTAAIQAAVNNCSNRTAVYLPTGTYLVSNTITIPSGYPAYAPSISIRGDGPGLTVITYTNVSGSGADVIDFHPGYQYTATTSSITGGLTQGSSSILVTNGGSWKSGEIVSIAEQNDTNFVNINNYDGDACTYCGDGTGNWCLQQYVRITNISGNTLSINPPLLWSYNPNLQPTVQNKNWVTNCGVEDLTIKRLNPTMTSSGANIDFNAAAWCWATNVESAWAQGQHFRLDASFQCQISDCYIHDAASYVSGEGYGVWLLDYNAYDLIENCIFHNYRHAMVTEGGGAGCVFAYNFATNSIAGEDPTTFLSGDELQHGAHAWFILYEGNVCGCQRVDWSHGSSSHITHFREYVTLRSYCESNVANADIQLNVKNFPGSWVTNQGGFYGADFETWAYSNSVVGCVYSTNIFLATNYNYSPPALFMNIPTAGALPTTYGGALATTAPVVNNIGGQPMVLRVGYLSPGATGAITDTNVGPSTYWHGNWDPINNSVIWDPSNSDHSIPNSLYLNSAPSWWGALPWPATGPDLTPMVGMIPAQLRWIEMTAALLPPTNLHIVNSP